MAHTNAQDHVSVGLGTQVGYGTGLVAFVLAIISFFSGHGGDEDTINTIVTGAISLGMVGVTTLGRQLQAAAAKKGIDVKNLPVKVDVDEAAVKAAVESKLVEVLGDLDDRIHHPTDGEVGVEPDPLAPSRLG